MNLLGMNKLAVRGDDGATDGETGDSSTDRLIERANRSGEALFTRTVLEGRSVLRVSIGARSTQQRHVDAAWKLLTTALDSIS